MKLQLDSKKDLQFVVDEGLQPALLQAIEDRCLHPDKCESTAVTAAAAAAATTQTTHTNTTTNNNQKTIPWSKSQLDWRVLKQKWQKKHQSDDQQMNGAEQESSSSSFEQAIHKRALEVFPRIDGHMVVVSPLHATAILSVRCFQCAATFNVLPLPMAFPDITPYYYNYNSALILTPHITACNNEAP